MGRGRKHKGFSKHKEAVIPRSIIVRVTYQEDELVACKTEEQLDKLFNEKIETAMGNFKVDIKKFFGFIKEESKVEVKDEIPF